MPFVSITESHPEIAAEAYGWNPSEFSKGSHSKMEWRCTKGHTYFCTIKDRTRTKNSSGCPYCANRKLLIGFNDFKTKYPDFADEAFEWDPSEIRISDSESRKWICKNQHIWIGTVSARVKSRSKCPYCSGKKAITGLNDLTISHPELSKEAFGWDPRLFKSGSNFKMEWRCSKGHNWKAIISSRAKGKLCPYCSGHFPAKGETDLLTKFPEIASEAFGWDPSSVHYGATATKKWKCKLGHTWQTSVAHRTKDKTGCPICNNFKVLQNFNDLTTTHPEIAKEAFGWNPSEVIAGNHSRKEWKCPLGHIYSSTIVSRTSAKTGCPICSGQSTLAGFNDIGTQYPNIAQEAYGWDPKMYVSSSHKRMQWKCNLGHTWNARIFSRTKNGLGCPICAGKEVLIGFNDLSTTHPEIASQAYEWDPKSVSKGHGVKKKWKCSEGHIWMARPATRVQGFGCPSCAKSGFDPNNDGYLYFLSHEDWQMLQIGITNYPENRLKSHQKLGWEVIEVRGPMDGHLTQQWETAILRMLKAKGADLSNNKIAGKFDGYSEAWSQNKFPADSIKQLMELTEEYESN